MSLCCNIVMSSAPPGDTRSFSLFILSFSEEEENLDDLNGCGNIVSAMRETIRRRQEATSALGGQGQNEGQAKLQLQLDGMAFVSGGVRYHSCRTAKKKRTQGRTGHLLWEDSRVSLCTRNPKLEHPSANSSDFMGTPLRDWSHLIPSRRQTIPSPGRTPQAVSVTTCHK